MSTLSSVTYHLVRRGLEEKPSDPDQPDRPFPALGFTVVILTALLMFLICSYVCVLVLCLILFTVLTSYLGFLDRLHFWKGRGDARCYRGS